LPTFLSLVTLTTFFLASSVESAGTGKMDCPSSSKTTSFANSKEDQYIVSLRTEDTTHSEWLKECWGIDTKSILSDNFTAVSKKQGTVYSFTVKGTGLNGYTGTFPDQFVKEHLSKRSEIKSIEKNAPVKTTYAIPNLSRRATQKNPNPNLDRIDQAKLPLDNSYTFPDTAGKDVNVFVVDTGIDPNHEQFEKRAKFLKSFCDAAQDCKQQDGNGHGSHVSGIVGGKTFGVANQVNLLGVQVLDAKGAGSNQNVINGLSFVLDQHKNGKNKNSVVNMSLGGAFSQAVNDAVKELTTAGVHVVVAAGNEAQDACNDSPASAPEAITVAALEDNPKADLNADFSNFGKCVDIFAPGRNIKSVKANTKNGIAIFSGTSQATPHVVGTVALLIAQGGNKSPAAMSKAIVDLSTKNTVKLNPKADPASLDDTTTNLLKVPAP